MRGLLTAGDHKPLVNYESLGREAMLSIPTPDHYLPLLYVIGTRQQADAISFPVEGVDGGIDLDAGGEGGVGASPKRFVESI